MPPLVTDTFLHESSATVGKAGTWGSLTEGKGRSENWEGCGRVPWGPAFQSSIEDRCLGTLAELGARAQLWASQPEQLGYGLGASSIGMGRIFSQKGSWKARWSGGRAAQRSLRRPRGTLLFENPMNSEFLSLLRSNLCFYDPEDTQQTNYLLGHW